MKWRKCNGYNAITWSTITRWSSTDWLRTVSMMDRYPADCRSVQYQSEGEKRYGLRRSGCLHILNWSGFWSFFIYFRGSLGEASFNCNTKLRHGIIVYRRFMPVWLFVIDCNRSRISEYRNILNICLQNVYFCVQQTTFFPIWWYNCCYSIEMTVKDHDKSFPITPMSGSV